MAMGRRRRNGKGNKRRGGVQPSARPPSPDGSTRSGSDLSLGVEELPLAVGTRVELPSLGDGRGGGHPRTGTVAGHWMLQESRPDRGRAPYMVLLDDGTAVYCHRTDADFLRETGVPAMEARLNVGCRVECRLEADSPRWFPGTILQRNREWASSPADTPPYFIRFDYGRERPFWGPADRIRAIDGKRNGNLPDLRFERGDRVACSVGDGWIHGLIVKTWYREDHFEEGHAAPYQVLLDTGEFIYAPMDDDACIKKSSRPLAPLRFDVGDEVVCNVEEGWEPGIVITTGCHMYEDKWDTGKIVPYEIQLDMGDIVCAPVDSDLFVRRNLRFQAGERVECSTDDGWMLGTVVENRFDDYDDCDALWSYKVRLDAGDVVRIEEDDDELIRRSAAPRVCRGTLNGFVRVMSKTLIYNGQYGEAEGILRERIDGIRSGIGDDADDDDAERRRQDLSYFLVDLAEVHQARGSLDDMKAALDESLSLTRDSRDESGRRRMLSIYAKLATHAALTSDKRSALRYSEEAVLLARLTTGGHDSFRLGLMLFQCGKLNVGCGADARGMAQMLEGLEMLTRLYGEDNKQVRLAKEELHEILISDG